MYTRKRKFGRFKKGFRRYKKSVKRYAKRRGYRRRNARSRVSIARESYFQKDETMVKIKWCTTPNYNISFVATNPNLLLQSWRANSLYLPDSSQTGNIPQAWIQWQSLYNKYTVFGCKAKITIWQETSVRPWKFSLFPVEDPSDIPSTVPLLAENWPYAKSGLCNEYLMGNNQKLVLKNYMSTRKILQVKDVVDDHLLSGNGGSAPTSPAKLWYWYLAGRNPWDGSVYTDATTSTLAYQCELVFYVRLFDRVINQVSFS